MPGYRQGYRDVPPITTFLTTPHHAVLLASADSFPVPPDSHACVGQAIHVSPSRAPIQVERHRIAAVLGVVSSGPYPVPPVTVAPSTTSKSSSLSCVPTTTLFPGSSEPSRIMRESWLSTRRWMVRLRGRAPNSGSKPSSAKSPTASSVNSTSTSWALRRLLVR